MIFENVLKVMEFFCQLGFTPEQAAGIVGNLMQESGLDPGIHQIGGGGGFGLAQWTHPRRKYELMAFAAKQGRAIDDLSLQLDFIVHEIDQPGFSGAKRALLSAHTVEDATMEFCNHYEIPGKPMMERRIKYAQQALKMYLESFDSSKIPTL